MFRNCKGGYKVKDLFITYKQDLLPYIHLGSNGLWINTLYCRIITPEFLKGVIIDLGYDDVTDVIIEQIIAFARIYDEEEDFVLQFPLKEKSGE
jgi:hypothetical protein